MFNFQNRNIVIKIIAIKILHRYLNSTQVWDFVEPMFQTVFEGQATWSEDQLLLLTRNNYLEESYFTWSFTPVRGEDGAVAGVLNPITETTQRVLSERRMR